MVGLWGCSGFGMDTKPEEGAKRTEPDGTSGRDSETRGTIMRKRTSDKDKKEDKNKKENGAEQNPKKIIYLNIFFHNYMILNHE